MNFSPVVPLADPRALSWGGGKENSCPLVQTACYTWEFAGSAIFWPYIVCGWEFSRFFPYTCDGSCFMASGVGVVRHFLSPTLLLLHRGARLEKKPTQFQSTCIFQTKLELNSKKNKKQKTKKKNIQPRHLVRILNFAESTTDEYAYSIPCPHTTLVPKINTVSA